jgi:hypothetical protein
MRSNSSSSSNACGDAGLSEALGNWFLGKNGLVAGWAKGIAPAHLIPFWILDLRFWIARS